MNKSSPKVVRITIQSPQKTKNRSPSPQAK